MSIVVAGVDHKLLKSGSAISLWSVFLSGAHSHTPLSRERCLDTAQKQSPAFQYQLKCGAQIFPYQRVGLLMLFVSAKVRGKSITTDQKENKSSKRDQGQPHGVSRHLSAPSYFGTRLGVSIRLSIDQPKQKTCKNRHENIGISVSGKMDICLLSE